MPGPVSDSAKKRKRASGLSQTRKRARSEEADNSDKDRIQHLESEILESKKNYNNISVLISTTRDEDSSDDLVLCASVSLCRVFMRLMASGALAIGPDLSEKEAVVAQWLRDRLMEYRRLLLLLLSRSTTAPTSLTLAMRLLKAEAERSDSGREEYSFSKVFFTDIVRTLVRPDADETVRQEFCDKFVNEYDDLRFFLFKSITGILGDSSTDPLPEGEFDTFFSLLSAVDGVPDADSDLDSFYVEPPRKKSHSLLSLSQHKKVAQEAWLALINRSLSREQRKRVLASIETAIAPWFTKPELLADFLTDCYDAGGSLSLLALSGVFYLIQERNLDYPTFYPKLYSLLDADILHSKHRSRFLRLMDTFLGSSHLPVALVASFIKRLSRLSLNAPPGAIVFIVPWIYNLFKKHPLTTFMMHRVPRTQQQKDDIEANGAEDPFLENEPDPMKTLAIDSCVWELVQLQSHYHPNVANVCKIISEQFTKQSYNIEDFLDHSYGSILETETSKELTKAPVVEFMIPKRVFLRQDAESEQADSLLVKLWDFA